MPASAQACVPGVQGSRYSTQASIVGNNSTEYSEANTVQLNRS